MRADNHLHRDRSSPPCRDRTPVSSNVRLRVWQLPLLRRYAVPLPLAERPFTLRIPARRRPLRRNRPRQHPRLNRRQPIRCRSPRLRRSRSIRTGTELTTSPASRSRKKAIRRLSRNSRRSALHSILNPRGGGNSPPLHFLAAPCEAPCRGTALRSAQARQSELFGHEMEHLVAGKCSECTQTTTL